VSRTSKMRQRIVESQKQTMGTEVKRLEDGKVAVESPVIERVGEEERMRGLLVGFKYAVVLGAYGGLLWHVNSLPPILSLLYNRSEYHMPPPQI
jgi:hypothetical protein